MTRASAHERGFTLIEVLVALAIAGVLMLSAAGLYWQQKEIGERLVAERVADAALENAYELLRADPEAPVGAPGMTLTVSVTEGPVPRTHALDIVATYRIHGQPFRRSLAAIVYDRPVP